MIAPIIYIYFCLHANLIAFWCKVTGVGETRGRAVVRKVSRFGSKTRQRSVLYRTIPMEFEMLWHRWRTSRLDANLTERLFWQTATVVLLRSSGQWSARALHVQQPWEPAVSDPVRGRVRKPIPRVHRDSLWGADRNLGGATAGWYVCLHAK